MVDENFWGLMGIAGTIAGGVIALWLEMRKSRGEMTAMNNFLRATNSSAVDGKIAMLYAYAY